jgi:hypothetical protein
MGVDAALVGARQNNNEAKHDGRTCAGIWSPGCMQDDRRSVQRFGGTDQGEHRKDGCNLTDTYQDRRRIGRDNRQQPKYKRHHGCPKGHGFLPKIDAFAANQRPRLRAVPAVVKKMAGEARRRVDCRWLDRRSPEEPYTTVRFLGTSFAASCTAENITPDRLDARSENCSSGRSDFIHLP